MRHLSAVLGVIIVLGLVLLGCMVVAVRDPATKVTPVYIEYNPANHNDGLVLVYDPDTGDCKVINITHPSK